jgi:hypothetical protein
MPRGEWTSDSSSDSDGTVKDPFADPQTSDFIIPSPKTLSDAEDDVSPSQYRKEMASKQSRGQSDDEDGEEEDDGEEEEMDEEEEAREPVKENRSAMESMYSDVINIARSFTSMVEETKRKELMSRKKTARLFLDFDSPPRKPAKYRHQQFTPPRHAREQIKATQYEDDDCERDSLCSSQTGSTRVRLQERWRASASEATCNGLYTLYNSAVLCQDTSCGFCTQIFEPVSEDGGTKWKQYLLSDDAANLHYKLEKPSSDSTPSVFAWAKEKFGEDCQVQQCGFHLSSNLLF